MSSGHLHALTPASSLPIALPVPLHCLPLLSCSRDPVQVVGAHQQRRLHRLVPRHPGARHGAAGALPAPPPTAALVASWLAGTCCCEPRTPLLPSPCRRCLRCPPCPCPAAQALKAFIAQKEARWAAQPAAGCWRGDSRGSTPGEHAGGLHAGAACLGSSGRAWGIVHRALTRAHMPPPLLAPLLHTHSPSCSVPRQPQPQQRGRAQ